MVFKRDDYVCQSCGTRGGQLIAEHIKPYALFPELRWELSNGETLCVGCHKLTPTYGAKLEKQRAIYQPGPTTGVCNCSTQPEETLRS